MSKRSVFYFGQLNNQMVNLKIEAFINKFGKATNSCAFETLDKLEVQLKQDEKIIDCDIMWDQQNHSLWLV